MKLVTDLGENEVIHCPTLEEAEAICRLMDGAGLRWITTNSYLDYNNWESDGKNTCYCPKQGQFSQLSYYEKKGYTIHKASEFLTEQTK